MAKIEEKITRDFLLALEEKEARFLMAYLQNYHGNDKENSWDAEIRKEIFTALYGKLIGKEEK